MAINITMAGNLTAAPVTAMAASGVQYTRFSIAHNEQDKPDGTPGAVIFMDCTAFGTLAANIVTLTKGTRITVTGRLSQDNWIDKATQTKRSKHVIKANDVAASALWSAVTSTRIPREVEGNNDPI